MNEHRIYWRREYDEARFWAVCPRGCGRHPPGTFRYIGSLGPGRAEHYLGTAAPPWWLCGYGIPGGVLMHALALIARDPNAGAGWIGRRRERGEGDHDSARTG